MSKVVRFRRGTPRRVRIVAEKLTYYRYTVLPDEDLPFVALQTFCLDDAKATAADFSDTTLEIGPSEAFNQRLRS
jgi:hypothetical protein